MDKKVNRRVAVVNRPSSSTQSGGLWVLEPISWFGVFIIHVDDSCLLRLSVGVGVVRGIGQCDRSTRVATLAQVERDPASNRHLAFTTIFHHYILRLFVGD